MRDAAIWFETVDRSQMLVSLDPIERKLCSSSFRSDLRFTSPPKYIRVPWLDVMCRTERPLDVRFLLRMTSLPATGQPTVMTKIRVLVRRQLKPPFMKFDSDLMDCTPIMQNQLCVRRCKFPSLYISTSKLILIAQWSPAISTSKFIEIKYRTVDKFTFVTRHSMRTVIHA